MSSPRAMQEKELDLKKREMPRLWEQAWAFGDLCIPSGTSPLQDVSEGEC